MKANGRMPSRIIATSLLRPQPRRWTSGLPLVPALQFTITLQHLEVNRVLAIDLCGAVPLDDIEPRHRSLTERHGLQLLLGQQRVVVGPRLDSNHLRSLPRVPHAEFGAERV